MKLRRQADRSVTTAAAVIMGWRNIPWVLKNSVSGMLFWSSVGACELLFPLSSDRGRCCLPAEEPHQSLNVLSGCRKPELLPNELHAS